MSNEPVAWIESPHGVIRGNQWYRVNVPQSLSWSIPLYTHPARDDTALLRQLLHALEIGYDSVKAEVAQYHEAMAGYRQYRHDQMDADVQQIANAITALRERLGEKT